MVKGIFKKKAETVSRESWGGEEALSDIEFLEQVYQQLLGRGADETGKNHHLNDLKQGHSRLSVILGIVRSEEFVNKVIRENMPLLSVKEERAERYRLTRDIRGQELWIFQAEEPGDFDWLERKIVENGYYEMPAVWSFLISEDKRLHAEIVSLFKPRRVLDCGCANGPVMKCLHDLGIPSEGVDISRLALARAFPEVRDNIRLGDLLALDFKKRFDFVLGLDIIEHLNPNKLGLYIEKIESLMEEGGYLFCNIPAFGNDEVFGTIFEVYLKEWEADIQGKRLFSIVPTDASGYPVNGHLIGAGSAWWVAQFERHGLHRETEVEIALHNKYDEAMIRNNAARKAFYVFSKAAKPQDRNALLKRLRAGL
jgi:2-polyprenyl-3-methyl-5-hydroxy-6-metoxy-1,4-benzoquinol methylase